MPLRPDVDVDGLACQPDHIEIEQQSVLMDLGRAVHHWGGQRRELRQGAVATLVAVAIILGILIVEFPRLVAGGPAKASPVTAPIAAAPRPTVTVTATAGNSTQTTIDDSEIAPFQRDWPGLTCPADPDSSRTDPPGTKCTINGIELYMWTFTTHAARNRNRSDNIRTAANPKQCAPGNRLGTWSTADGRAGRYVDTPSPTANISAGPGSGGTMETPARPTPWHSYCRPSGKPTWTVPGTSSATSGRATATGSTADVRGRKRRVNPPSSYAH